jgi:cytochrome c-type biogenesis protein CcmH
MLMFWLLATVLCLATVGLLLAVKVPDDAVRAGHNEGALAIYKDQLKELDRDVAAGVVEAEEAEAQRIEISRRLLTVGREVTDIASAPQRFPKQLVLAVPLLAAVLYYQIGDWALPDVPRQQRLAAAETSNDWDALIARVEQQLEKNPDDIEGWQLLVPNYLNMGRYQDAVRAMGRVAEIKGPTAELYSNMAEALVADNKGLMTAQSVAIVSEALKLDPKHPKALFYHAFGLAQEGKTAEAKAAYATLLALAPPSAPWRVTVEAELAKLQPSATAPQISTEQMQGAEGMTADERTTMIRAMVDGLDGKLKTNPDDIQGWLRLIRARTVLNESDKAVAALTTARTTFATKPDQMKALDDLAKELNLK